MGLPTFRSIAARRQERKQERTAGIGTGENRSEQAVTPTTYSSDAKRTTRARQNATIISCVSFFVSTIFLLLTVIGNINTKPVIRSTYFFKLNIADIIPASAGDIVFVNSLARSLGLHDFYQVGLWNFCEGYNNEGITHCSHPRNFWWFNPVEIIVNELLAGATIALPAKIVDILTLIRIASQIMFFCFVTGVCLNFVSILLAPLSMFFQRLRFPFVVWTFIAAVLTSLAAIIATVMFTVFRKVITSQPGLNIGASLGISMFVFMWIGTVCSTIGGVIHLSMSCHSWCRRRAKARKNKGSNSTHGPAAVSEKA